VPVLEGEHLVGLITRTDLMRVLLQPEPQAGPVGAARPVA
jgi:CBS domain-containing protein